MVQKALLSVPNAAKPNKQVNKIKWFSSLEWWFISFFPLCLVLQPQSKLNLLHPSFVFCFFFLNLISHKPSCWHVLSTAWTFYCCALLLGWCNETPIHVIGRTTAGQTNVLYKSSLPGEARLFALLTGAWLTQAAALSKKKKSIPQHGDNSQKLCRWSSLHTMQEATHQSLTSVPQLLTAWRGGLVEPVSLWRFRVLEILWGLFLSPFHPRGNCYITLS